MTLLSTEKLRTLIADYLGEIISTSDFADSFDQAAWNLDELSPEDAALRGDVYLALAEFSRGHMDESELRDELRSLVSDPVWVYADAAYQLAHADSQGDTQITARRFLGRAVTFGTPRVLVSA